MCLWLSWSLTLKSSMSYWREHRRDNMFGSDFASYCNSLILHQCIPKYPTIPLYYYSKKCLNRKGEQTKNTASKNIDLRLVNPNQQFTSIHLVSFKNTLSLSPSPFKNCTHVFTAFDKSIIVGDVGWPNHLFDLPRRMSTSVFSSKSWVRPR